MVVRIDHSTGYLSVKCGKGLYGFAVVATCSTNPKCSACADNGTIANSSPAPTAYLIVCRDPSAGPGRLTLSW